MKKNRLLFVFVAACLFVSCQSSQHRPSREIASDDQYLWLEEVEGDKALDWARARNAETFEKLKGDPRFSSLEAEIRGILLAKDRVPSVSLINGKLWNFWKDEKNVRGVWRFTTPEKYAREEVEWENVLDLDALAITEKENWVWQGSVCLEPDGDLCLIALSRGGKDASVVREFNVKTKSFVAGGFVIPEGRNSYSWIDRDTILVGSDFGPGTVSKSGYSVSTREWKRGTPLAAAPEVYRGSVDDAWAWESTIFTPEKHYRIRSRRITFFESEISLRGDDGSFKTVPMPSGALFQGIYRGDLLYQLRQELKVGKKIYVPGTLVALSIRDLFSGKELSGLTEIFRPTRRIFLSDVSVTKSALLLDVKDNVYGKVLRATKNSHGRWQTKPLPIGKGGVSSIASTENDSDDFVATYHDFTAPSSTYFGSAVGASAPKLVKKAPERFNGSGLKTEQWWAKSKDGTRVPYFIIYPGNLRFDGKAPTVLYGYGGFSVSMEPFYLGAYGKVWSEKGGVYVLANIRGGGEFGPEWHSAALKENRQRAYDDFAAVAEDLIRRKVTSSAHLGIQGGSNGGLLVGVAVTQRPDLYNAVACEVPLLDMLRFHKLLAGHSWIGEYGDPEKQEERAYLEKYSPFQNLRPGVRYPEIFTLTSTKDDRVHPGHARRFVAKLRDLGQNPLYYENIEGGHGGAANIEQRILWSALEWTYFWRKLGAAQPMQ